MIAGIHILQEIFSIDMLTALKPFLEHDGEHVLRLLGLYENQALVILNSSSHFKVQKLLDRQFFILGLIS